MAYDLTYHTLYPVYDLFTPQEFPLAPLIPLDALGQVFEGLYYTDEFSSVESDGLHVSCRLAFETPIEFQIPGLPGITLVVAGGTSGWSSFVLEATIGPEPTASVREVTLALRASRDYLQPMKSRTEVDSDKQTVEIGLGEISFELTASGIEFDGEVRVDLPLSMVGETGIIISAQGMTLHLGEDSSAPNQPVGWKGLYIESASLDLPGDIGATVGNLTVADCSIGSGGFSCRKLSSRWDPIPLEGTLYGFNFSLSKVDVEFKQNSLVSGAMEGSINLPFFDGPPIGLVIGLDLSGDFTVAIAAVQPPEVDYNNGLVTIEKVNVLRLTLESLRFSIADSGFTISLSCEVTPLVGANGLSWPSFRVQELSIDSEGNVHLEGGWLNLREQYTLSLYGFQLEICKMGFGSADDGRRWIGFSGGLKLVDGLKAGASVEGLRILWDPATNETALTFNGLGVEFMVPEAIYFKGSVAMKELPGGGVRFEGDITLSLLSLNFEAEAQLFIGYDRQNDYSFFAIYLGVELPAGIPILNTGLGLYGIAGLFPKSTAP